MIDPSTRRKVSVIDLGYNSLKMVSYEVRSDGSFVSYDQIGELTKIGEGMDKTGNFSREAMDRTLNVLKLFNEVNRMEKIDQVLAVATSAVREARNGAQFVAEAESVANIRFRTLSPEEEALFSYIGGAGATRYQTILFFDLGGGSLEFTYAKDHQVRRLLSVPLGALRMTEQYGTLGGGYTKKDYDKLQEKINELLPTREGLGLADDTVLVGVGGTVRALARYDQWRREYPLNNIHNYVLRRKPIMTTHKILRELTTDKISHMDSFGKDRAESISTGSLIIAMMMNRLEFDELVVSTHGLRDGILSEYIRDPVAYSGNAYTPEIANSSFTARYPEDSRANVIRSLAGLGIVDSREASTLMESVYSFMDLYLSTRPETLFYYIMSQDSILDHKEQLAAAIALVRAKAPKMARWFHETYEGLLDGIERKSIYRMGAVFQLTEILYLTGSSASFSLHEGELSIDISSRVRGETPNLLLVRASNQLEEVTDLRIKATVDGRPCSELTVMR